MDRNFDAMFGAGLPLQRATAAGYEASQPRRYSPSQKQDLMSVLSTTPQQLLQHKFDNNGEFSKYPIGRVQGRLNRGQLPYPDYLKYRSWASDVGGQLASKYAKTPGTHERKQYLDEVVQLQNSLDELMAARNPIAYTAFPPPYGLPSQPQQPRQSASPMPPPAAATAPQGTPAPMPGTSIPSPQKPNQWSVPGFMPRANQQAMAQRMAMTGRGPQQNGNPIAQFRNPSGVPFYRDRTVQGPDSAMRDLQSIESADRGMQAESMRQDWSYGLPTDQRARDAYALQNARSGALTPRYGHLGQMTTSPVTLGGRADTPDSYRADALQRVLNGESMRFGPNSPESMFKQNVIRQPGQMGGVVHPMMPSTGGPMPQRPDVGSFPARETPQETAMRVNGPTPQGQMRQLPFSYNPQTNAYHGSASWDNPNDVASRVAGLQRLGQDFSFNQDGQAVDQFGNQVGGRQLFNAFMGAQGAKRDQHIQDMRTNSAIRNSFRDAQRGNPSGMLQMASRGLVGQNVLNAMIAANAPAPFIAVNDGRFQNQANPQAPQNPIDQKMGMLSAITPFIAHLPPEGQQQLMGQMIGHIFGGQKINMGQLLGQAQRMGQTAKSARKTQITATPQDVAGIPDMANQDAAYNAFVAANPGQTANFYNSGMVQKYPGWVPPHERGVLGGLGKSTNPQTGAVENAWYHPSSLMDAFRSLQYGDPNAPRTQPPPPPGQKQPRSLNPMTW